MPYHALVITPEGRPLNIGLAEVPLSLAFLEGPHHCLLPAIVHALGLADAVEAPLAAPAGTRFALDTRTGDVFLDGLLLDALAPAPKKFLTLLLKARGERVSTEAINDAIARTRGDDGAARQMKRRALLQIAESFRKAGRRPSGSVDDLIVRDKDGGYRVAASIFVR